MKKFSVQLNNKDRHIAFNNFSIMELEEKVNMSVFALMGEFAKMGEGDDMDVGKFPRAKTIYCIAWAGLLQHHDMKFKDVVNSFGVKDYETVLPVFIEALTDAIGINDVEQAEGTEKKPTKPKASA